MHAPSENNGLLDILRQYWGYDSFLPLQQAAMAAVLEGRDSLVVMPTGGGKSLCYQAPALCMDGMAIVVSPLISLMKDQVDALLANGIPAAHLNSTLLPHESRDVVARIRAGLVKLLYIAPERLTNEPMLDLLAGARVSFVAVDEAHCVSMWGHDFRPHYRELKILKQTFPNIAVHGYTATATERVRKDVSGQLVLNDPDTIIGSFDRPNLIYTVARRSDYLRQIIALLKRHPNESGIIYCISRKNVDETSAALNELGYQTAPYHAGMSDEDRQTNQEAFREDRLQIIVATIAFGMGIDKPDVRFVIHAGLPKSLENYQQESGRAGRDGLEAECCLLYSEQDAFIWKRIMGDQPPNMQRASCASLDAILGYCRGVTCRHRALLQHFGQDLDADCGSGCDVCRDGFDAVADPLTVGQKILSSVHRQDQRFGAAHTAKVLKGSRDKKVLENGHDRLSTYGILRDESTAMIRHWIDQLLAQAFLDKTADYQQLILTDRGWQLLRGETTPDLVRLKETPKEKGEAKRRQPAAESPAADSWEGVDRGLFEALRMLRMELARDRNWPPYVVFSDVALRDMARRRPSDLDRFLECRGVGQKKRDDFGQTFLDSIAAYCAEYSVTLDPESG